MAPVKLIDTRSKRAEVARTGVAALARGKRTISAAPA